VAFHNSTHQCTSCKDEDKEKEKDKDENPQTFVIPVAIFPRETPPDFWIARAGDRREVLRFARNDKIISLGTAK
jgi:hypothetical protein